MLTLTKDLSVMCVKCVITQDKPVDVVRSPATLSKVLTVDLILQQRLSDIFV